MRAIQHINFVLITQTRRFERLAKIAIEPRDGREIVHARKADALATPPETISYPVAHLRRSRPAITGILHLRQHFAASRCGNTISFASAIGSIPASEP